MIKQASDLRLGDYFFNIEAKDFKTDETISVLDKVAKAAMDPKYYTVKRTEVESLAVDKQNKDLVVINDTIKLPKYINTPADREAADRYYTDETEVTRICVDMTNVEMTRMQEMEELIIKHRTFCNTMIEKNSFI